MARLSLSSPAFADGDRIPREYGYTRENVNPPLEIEGVPEDADGLALVMDDPDALGPAGKIWVHWVLWNVDPTTEVIPEGSTPPGATAGTNDFGETGYGGPNPPDGEHTYVFTLYALETGLDLAAGSTKADLEAAIEGRVLAETRLEGTYAP